MLNQKDGSNVSRGRTLTQLKPKILLNLYIASCQVSWDPNSRLAIFQINLEGDELQPVLEAHLRSDDFFFTKMFPNSDLTSFQIRMIAGR